MTNQQLKAHCEDVIANAQEHQDWVVDMARVALSSLEAEPVAYDIQDADARARGETGFLRRFANISAEDIAEYEINITPLYTAPSVPELKPIELPVMQVDNPIDGFFYKCDEVIAAICAAGYEVKS